MPTTKKPPQKPTQAEEQEAARRALQASMDTRQ